MVNAIKKFIKKWWWAILALIAIWAFWSTIVKVIQWVLIAALVFGILYFIMRIPGVKSWLRLRWVSLKHFVRNKPGICAVILGVILVIILGVIFAPGWIANSTPSASTTPAAEQQGNTATPSNQPSSQPSGQPSSDPSSEAESPAVEIFTPENMEGFSIKWEPADGTEPIAITSYVNARAADGNPNAVQYPAGHDGKYDGVLCFDFQDSGKEIQSVKIVRFDTDYDMVTEDSSYTFDLNDPSRFPYPDAYMHRNSSVYSSHLARITFIFEFTDGTFFQGVLTLSGKAS